MLTPFEQDNLIQAKYDLFEAVFIRSWGAYWVGTVFSFDTPYRIHVWYQTGGSRGEIEYRTLRPQVYVVDPPLRRRTTKTDEPIPHIFPYTGRRGPRLCLYFSQFGEWDFSMPIADTIIPWTSKWLCYYEIWHTTGKWKGGGIHPGDEGYEWQQPEYPDRVARFNTRAFNKIGQETGTFASLPLMAVASEEYFQLLSWQRWNEAYRWAVELANISTLSQELPLAV